MRHVELGARQRAQSRLDGHRFVADIGDHAQPVARIEPPRDFGDVGGRVAIAEIGFEVRPQLLGEDLAMSFLGEAIDHDAVMAGDVAKHPRRFLAQWAQRVAGQEGLQRGLDPAGDVGLRKGRFEFHHQPAPRRTME